jgi:hypothetical protein
MNPMIARLAAFQDREREQERLARARNIVHEERGYDET